MTVNTNKHMPAIPYVKPPNSSWVLWSPPGGTAPPQWLSLEDAPLSLRLGPQTRPETRPRPSSPERHEVCVNGRLLSPFLTTFL